jgi:NDP-sugar pyrophosphorylase family protein
MGDVRTAAVLAGGLGTRLSSVTVGRLPKALVPVGGRPFLAYKLDELARAGVERAVVLVGVHGDQVVGYLARHSWPLEVVHLADGDTLLGTGGAVKHAAAELPDRFWVTYGDTLLSADLRAVEAWAGARQLDAVMTVLHNNDRWEPSNVSVDGPLVASYGKGAPKGTHDHLDYGYLLLPNEAFAGRPEDHFDLSVVVQSLIVDRRLGAFVVDERFHDVGTPEALDETGRWLAARGSDSQ